MRKYGLIFLLPFLLLADTKQKIELGYFGTTGNSNSTSLTAGYSIQSDISDATTAKFWADILYSTKEGQTDNERYRANARVEHSYTKRLFTFLEISFLRNTFQGYDAQYGINPGVGYKLQPSKQHELDLLLGYAYRRNDLTSGQRQDLHYAKTELDYNYQITNKNSLQANLYFIENLSNSSDYESKLDTSLNLSIIDKLGFKLSYEIKYDNLPPIGKKKTDTLTKASIVYEF